MKIDYSKFPVFKEICNIIEYDTVGIEMSLIYNLIINYSKYCMNRNRAVWLSAPKSYGKGLSITAIENKNEVIIKRDKITPTYLTKFLGDMKNIPEKMTIILEDISTIIDSDYHTHCFFNLMSKLIWDKNYGEGTNELYAENINIKEPTIRVDKLSCHIGGTYEHIYKIKRYYQAYSTFWNDRITEYYIFYTSTHIDDMQDLIFENALLEPNRPDLSSLINQSLPKRQTIDIKISKDIDKSLLRNVFEETLGVQHSYNRGIQYFIADLKAIAYINKRDYICNDDILFYYLFKPNIGIQHKISVVKLLFFSTISDNINYISKQAEISLNNIKKTAYSNPTILNLSGDIIKPTLEFNNTLLNQVRFIENLKKN